MHIFQNIHWRPGIGDPTLMGWLTVAAYALTAFTAFAAARRAGRAPGTTRGSRGMWNLVGVFMTLLCINKQLDLQSLFTDIGRVIAWHQGWYGDRRAVQKAAVLLVLATSSLTAAILIIRFRDFWKKHFLLSAGLAFSTTFIIVRAISFHHVDLLLKARIAGVKMNWFLELTGIALILAAALSDYRHPRKSTKRNP